MEGIAGVFVERLEGKAKRSGVLATPAPVHHTGHGSFCVDEQPIRALKAQNDAFPREHGVRRRNSDPRLRHIDDPIRDQAEIPLTNDLTVSFPGPTGGASNGSGVRHTGTSSQDRRIEKSLRPTSRRVYERPSEDLRRAMLSGYASMSRNTPRATPLAPAPVRTLISGQPETDLSYWLRAPVVLVAPDRERELQAGALTIGRLASSDVPIGDPLVSRVHARVIVLADGAVGVEDLHSTNGVFVNGVRIGRGLRQLKDGDRLLIGTTELSLFASRTRSSDAPKRRLPAQGLPAAGVARTDFAATERADALEVVGRFATRLAQGGNVTEAVRVLSTHLNKVLLGATAGLSVPTPVLERAAHFAIELFTWTLNAAWIDYVLELHWTIQALPSEATLLLLESALKEPNVTFDRRLLQHLVEKLGERESLSAEALRVRRLAKLAP